MFFPGRLLGIGLPLSVVLGSLAAAWLFQDLSWALACFVGATLAPTDAALSAQVINDKRIPTRLRRTLNVESGLNDGIVTPVVAFMLAAAASQLEVGGGGHSDEGGALVELAVGVIVGLAVGAASAGLISLGSRRRWIITGGRTPRHSGCGAEQLRPRRRSRWQRVHRGVRGWDRFRRQLDRDLIEVDDAVELPELLGEIMMLVVWFLFGAALVPITIDNFDVAMLVYALLSLTVIRIVPVAVSLVGSGLDRWSVLFVGWFGPRGLASIVFALLAVEELGEAHVVEQAVAVVAVTVLLSVVLHGVSAGPLGSRYVRLEQAEDRTAGGPRPRRPGHRHGTADDSGGS